MKKIVLLLVIVITLSIVGLIVLISINQYVKGSTKNKILEDFSNIKDIDAILILGIH